MFVFYGVPFGNTGWIYLLGVELHITHSPNFHRLVSRSKVEVSHTSQEITGAPVLSPMMTTK